MDDATSLVSTVESEKLSAEVEKDGVFSAGRLTPTTPVLHKHTTSSSSIPIILQALVNRFSPCQPVH